MGLKKDTQSFYARKSCRGLGINPCEYLEDIMPRIMGHNSQKLHELLPYEWLESR